MGVQFNDYSQRYLMKARNEIERAITRGTIRVQREAVRLVTRNSGPIITLPGAPASAPGQPPHIRTGTLARSIEQETFRRGSDLIGRVGTNLNYGKFLEYGTVKMAPRPYLRPALASQRRTIVHELKVAGRRLK